jgi:hypothetical protein
MHEIYTKFPDPFPYVTSDVSCAFLVHLTFPAAKPKPRLPIYGSWTRIETMKTIITVIIIVIVIGLFLAVKFLSNPDNYR